MIGIYTYISSMKDVTIPNLTIFEGYVRIYNE